MRRFERRTDAFELAQQMECLDRLVVGRRHVLDPAPHLQPRMLGPACRNCSRVSLPITHRKWRAIAEWGCGPATVPV